MVCKRKSIIQLSQFVLVAIFIHLLMSCGSADKPLQGIDVNNEPIADLTAEGSVEDVIATLQGEEVAITAVLPTATIAAAATEELPFPKNNPTPEIATAIVE